MVYADFFKPTCKIELMTVSSKLRHQNLFMHAFVPLTSLKNLRIKQLQYDGDKTEHTEKKVFDKEVSIFKPWKEDDEYTYQQCAALDFKNWKVDRIC